MQPLFSLKKFSSSVYTSGAAEQYYGILIFKGQGRFAIDQVAYAFSGNIILFLSPYQKLQWLTSDPVQIHLIRFHGDFYCIEYHKKEVACNGLLFNNIYLHPHIAVAAAVFEEVLAIFQKVENERNLNHSFSETIIRTYIQLILALCSKEKSKQIENFEFGTIKNKHSIEFQELIEKYYRSERSVSFYASRLAVSSNTLSKKIKKAYGKTPTQLIQERVILEAKKLLHLTYKSVKEIAAELNFDDEFYFSRYFKKGTGLSPIYFRDKVGISVVAHKAME